MLGQLRVVESQKRLVGSDPLLSDYCHPVFPTGPSKAKWVLPCLWNITQRDPLPLFQKSRVVIPVVLSPYHLIDMVILPHGGPEFKVSLERVGPTAQKHYPGAVWKKQLRKSWPDVKLPQNSIPGYHSAD